MDDVLTFGLVVAAIAAAGLFALFSSRIGEYLRVPAPALFLVLAAVASDVWPALADLKPETVQRIVTVALIFVLFDGGMQIGWRRFRAAAGPIATVGIAGTFLTAAALAVVAHLLLGFDWTAALLLATALAPTDPAVVFSVLGKREVIGRSGTIIEGESGANDPVGIALMVSLVIVAAGGSNAVAHGVVEFVLQMTVGAGVGVLLGALLIRVTQRIALPGEALYPLRTMASAALIYGVATVAHGSGFLAVFVAGIMLGDVRGPYQREVRRVHASLASLGEIVAFAVLGLTISLKQVFTTDAWWIGLVLAVLLALVVRPLFVGALLHPVDLRRGEKVFVLWAGLKGAVPILLGTFVLSTAVPNARLIYHIIFVVVLFSVLVQGGLVPWVARRCEVPMETVETAPWSLGMRFRSEPAGVHRFRVETGSPADGQTLAVLDLGPGVWISVVRRECELVALTGDTVLRPGDEVLLTANPALPADTPDHFRADGG